MARHMTFLFDSSWILLVGGGLIVPCSLPRPPILKQLRQMVTMVLGQGWLFLAVGPLTEERKSEKSKGSRRGVPLSTLLLPSGE